MSISFDVVGFIPVNEEWIKMAAISKACIAANIAVPEKVCEYFDYHDPENLVGIPVDISDAVLKIDDGYQVDLTKLPRKDVHYIQFKISY